MKLKETLAELKAKGNEKVPSHNKKYGAGDQYGVPLGEIRKVAAKIKPDHCWNYGRLTLCRIAVMVTFSPLIETTISWLRF